MKKVLVPVMYQKLLAPIFKKHQIQSIPYQNGLVQDTLDKASDAEGIIVLTSGHADKKVMKQLPNLKIIARSGIGYDNVDLQNADKHKIWVTNTPGKNKHAVAENTVSDILIMSKHLYSTSSEMRGNGALSLYPRHVIYGKTVGVVGFGHIAREVIKMLAGFGVKILIWNHRKHETKYGKFVDWHTLITKSDYITLHIPAMPQTKHCINAKTFKAMKSNAFLINFARGELVDQTALINVIKHHEIAGAALDVYEKEPLPEDSELRTLPNVFLTPHCAGKTVESQKAMGLLAMKNVINVLSDEAPINPVNHIK